MSALGQKQPLITAKILTPEWLLSGRSGQSKLVNLAIVSGCFRPEADIGK
jgi:hypothetical protein